MNKFTTATLAVIASMVTISCTDANPVVIPQDNGLRDLNISILPVASRATAEPGVESESTVSDFGVYIYSADGGYRTVGTSTNSSLTIGEVPYSGSYYVLANLGATYSNFSTFASIESSEIALPAPADYLSAPLALTSGEIAAVSAGVSSDTDNDGITDRVAVTASMTPIFSRMEIGSVESHIAVEDAAGNALATDQQIEILSFTLSAILIDEAYDKYSYTFEPKGTKTDIRQTIDDALTPENELYDMVAFALLKDTPATGWAATASTAGSLAATAGTDLVWSYPVAPASRPRPVFELTNITYRVGATGTTETIAGKKYLTVGSYTGVASLTAGKIYKFDIDFDYYDLDDTPNEFGVNLDVTLDIQPWIFQNITANLM